MAAKTNFYEFRQNNSGGSFDIDDTDGIGPRVWIEATDAKHANARALRLGIYFDGCAGGRDCNCCGDRWSPAWKDDGEDTVEVDPEYDFGWHDTVYVHHLDGTIERHHAPDGEAA